MLNFPSLPTHEGFAYVYVSEMMKTNLSVAFLFHLSRQVRQNPSSQCYSVLKDALMGLIGKRRPYGPPNNGKRWPLGSTRYGKGWPWGPPEMVKDGLMVHHTW